MNSNSHHATFGDHFPDGLDEAAVNALIAEMEGNTAEAPEATSALLDGSAAERRRRRIERRAIAAVVRRLPVRPAMTSTAFEVGEVA